MSIFLALALCLAARLCVLIAVEGGARVAPYIVRFGVVSSAPMMPEPLAEEYALEASMNWSKRKVGDLMGAFFFRIRCEVPLDEALKVVRDFKHIGMGMVAQVRG